MPSRWSIWDKGKPAGASPMIATCLRAAIFMSIEPNGAAAVKSRNHMATPVGRTDGAITPSSADRIGRFGITTR
jgi:hypothetical protein